jgi:hypothetical protein
MSLVSGLYRMAPADWAGSPDERRVRMKTMLSRIRASVGQESMERAIRAYEPANVEEQIIKQVVLDHVEPRG